MFFRRFFERKLRQASYLVGCRESGLAFVIDPCRHVEQYIRALEACPDLAPSRSFARVPS